MKILHIIIYFLLFSPQVYLFSQSITDSSKSEIVLNYNNLSPYLDTNKYNVFPKKTNRVKLGLVLSGGGARGFAQIGVLKAFEEKSIQIDYIVGTSIGGIIGGLYASGYNANELDSLNRAIDWNNLISLSDKNQREFLFIEQKKTYDKSLVTLSLDGFRPVIPTSISSGQKLTEKINLLFLNARFKPFRNFNSLKIPFAVVATNFDRGEKTVFREGNISECIKASFTFPLLYSPTVINDSNYVDGGLTANIPVDVAKDIGADYVVAVNSTSPLKTVEEIKESPVNTADQVISITMAKLNELQLKKANFVITPNIKHHNAAEFTNFDSLISKGYQEAISNLEIIRNSLDSLESLASPDFNNFIINPEIQFEIPNLSDSLKKTIYDKQNQNFVRFTEIEKILKQIYETGNYAYVKAEINRTTGNLYLIYKAELNPKLETYSVTGLNGEAMKIFRKFWVENSDKYFNSKTLYKLYNDLLWSFRNNGKSLQNITEFRYNYSSGTLIINVNSGILDSILIQGNSKTKPEIILRETNFRKNFPLQIEELQSSLQNIYSSNLFKQVSLNLEVNPESWRSLLYIDLVEKSSRNLRLSIRADNERNLQFFVDVRNENMFGTGSEAGITMSGGLKNAEVRIETKSNRFFDTYFTYSLSAFYKFRDIKTYSEIIDLDKKIFEVNETGTYRDIRYGANFLLGTQIERIGTIFGQISLEELNIREVSGIQLENSSTQLLKLKFGGRIDSQDEFPFPKKGINLNYYYETAQNFHTKEQAFTKMLIDYEQYIGLSNNVNIKPRFIFGFADKTTPLQEQFRLGGENLFYGMFEDQLVGRQILLASVEYRYKMPFRIFFDTYLSLRYDLGRIWENAEDIRFKDLRHGIGLSAGFNTPIGKASFSAGKSFIINKGISDDTFVFGPLAFYFSIGYDF